MAKVRSKLPLIITSYVVFRVIIALVVIFLLFRASNILPPIGGNYSGVILIDSNEVIGQVNMGYGLNEDDNWRRFSTDPLVAEYHREVGSRLIRIWLSSQWYRHDAIPLTPQGWDFRALDTYVDAVIRAGAKPMICFAHAPVSNQPLHHINVHGDLAIVGHWELPPYDDHQFASYVEGVVRHYVNRHGNIDDWYIEIWNEPGNDEWWVGNPPRYSVMFNTVYNRIRPLTNAKIGGYSAGYIPGWAGLNNKLKAFLKHSNPDFVSFHHYGNVLGADYLSNTKILMYDAFIEAKKLAPHIEFINNEYNIHTEQLDLLNTELAATWYASALIWQIKSQVVSWELFYQGTSPSPDSHFGMWNSNLEPYPVFHMKSRFVANHPTGSDIIDLIIPNDLQGDIEGLATRQGNTIHITLVNKRSTPTVVGLAVIGGKQANFRLEGYEVASFLVR